MLSSVGGCDRLLLVACFQIGSGEQGVESGWSAFEFADRISGREAWPSDTASPPPVRKSTSGRKSIDPTTKASPMR